MGTFNLQVMSHPSAALAPNRHVWSADLGALVDYDISILKPAVLFADSVNLVTTREELRALARSEMAMANTMPRKRFMLYLELSMGYTPAMDSVYGISHSLLAPAQESERLRMSLSNREEGAFEAILDFLEPYHDNMEKTLRSYFDQAVHRYNLLGDGDISILTDSGIVSSQGWAPADINPTMIAVNGQQQYVDSWAGWAAESLVDATADAVMFEPGAHMAFSHHELQQNLKQASTGSLASTLAASTLGRLPGLTESPIREVLEIRNDLQEHLAAFRAEILDLESKISAQSDGSTQSIEKLIDSYWHRELNPALAEMHSKLKKGKYRRHVLDSFSTNGNITAAAGGFAANIGAVGVLLAGGPIAAGLAAMVTGIAAASVPLIASASAALKSSDEARDNRLYFLYEAGQRLNKFTG